jgi:putative sigma-54 modulation protein
MMKINIKATNIDLTEAIRLYVEKKLRKVEKKLIDPNDTSALCDVEVGMTTRHHQSGDIFRAEYNLSIAGDFVRVEAEKTDLYAAIDKAQNELYRALRSRKNKKRVKERKWGKKLKDFVHKFKR